MAIPPMAPVKENGASMSQSLNWCIPRARAREIVSFNIGYKRLGLAVNTGGKQPTIAGYGFPIKVQERQMSAERLLTNKR